VREARAHHHERRTRLGQLVARRAQRRDVVGHDVLHLVDQQRDAGADVLCQLRDVGEQLHQVDLDVTGVGAALGRRHVDARLPAVPQLRVARRSPQGERLQHAQHLLHPVRRTMPHGQVPHGPVQCRRQRPAQAGVRPGLDLAGAPTPAHGHRPQLAQQHRLADAPQAGQHQAAFRAPARHPFQHDVERRDFLLPSGKLGRALASAGGERVAHRVHDRKVSGFLARTRY
jgi:hypothetical protein